MAGSLVYEVLAALGWADGVMTHAERYAVVRAAWDGGVRGRDLDAVVEATKRPTDLYRADLSSLDAEDRLFLYAAAFAMARVEGSVGDHEARLLLDLRDHLGLEPELHVVAEVAAQVAPHTDPLEPSRRVVDFVALRDSLRGFGVPVVRAKVA